MRHRHCATLVALAVIGGCSFQPSVAPPPPSPTNPEWSADVSVRQGFYQPDQSVVERPAVQQFLLEGAHESVRHLHVASEPCDVVCPAYPRRK